MQKQSVKYIVINQEVAGQRIDNFLITYLKNVPKTHIYRILRKGEVRVNKKRIPPSYRLIAEDQLRLPPLQLQSPSTAKPSPALLKKLTDCILWENDDLLILNKPIGISVHGGSGIPIGIVEALRTLYPKLELAHRLDADTSGCLVFAKKRSVLNELHELMRTGAVRKIYWALTKGHWQAAEYQVDAPLRKNQLQSGERMVKVSAEGKTALTLFRPLQEFTESTLVEATLITGRTHQIRVHAQYQGHPIAGDDKYGDKEFNKAMRKLGLKRLFLHAYSIEFRLPSTGQVIHVVAPVSEELSDFLAKV